MIKLKKTIGTLFLFSWLPFMLAMAFEDANGDSGWYFVAGMMMIVFGTWSAILNLQDK